MQHCYSVIPIPFCWHFTHVVQVPSPWHTGSAQQCLWGLEARRRFQDWTVAPCSFQRTTRCNPSLILPCVLQFIADFVCAAHPLAQEESNCRCRARWGFLQNALCTILVDLRNTFSRKGSWSCPSCSWQSSAIAVGGVSFNCGCCICNASWCLAKWHVGSEALARHWCRGTCSCITDLFLKPASMPWFKFVWFESGALWECFTKQMHWTMLARSSLSEWIGGEDDDDIPIARGLSQMFRKMRHKNLVQGSGCKSCRVFLSRPRFVCPICVWIPGYVFWLIILIYFVMRFVFHSCILVCICNSVMINCFLSPSG